MTTENHPIASIGISVSPCAEATEIGFGNHVINRLTIRIAQFFLFKNVRVIFGHDWREDGVMRAVAKIAERSSSGGILNDLGPVTDRMFNLIPGGRNPVSQLAQDAQKQSDGILSAISLYDYLKGKNRESELPKNWPAELWLLRSCLTDILDPGGRICLGGTENGYSGYYSGIAEEAYYAIKYKKPLYLIGGFGGATKAVITALEGEELSDLALASLSPPKDIKKKEAASKFAAEFEMETEGLVPYFKKFGFGRKLTALNGLSGPENKQLADTTDVEVAVRLIWKGLQQMLK